VAPTAGAPKAAEFTAPAAATAASKVLGGLPGARVRGHTARVGRVRSTAGALVAVLVLAVVSSARASDDPSLRIVWEAPEGCPGARALDERLRTSLGGDPAELGRLGLVQADVEPQPGGYRLTLSVHDGERVSERVFEAARCAELVEAAAVAITLALQAPAVEIPPPPASEPPRVSPPPPAARDEAPPPEPSPAGTSLRWSLGAAGVLDVGALPSPALGVAISGRVALGAWSLGPYGVVLAPQQEAVGPGEQVEFGLFVAGLRGCYGALSGSLELSGCAAFEAGRFQAQGVALSPGRDVQDTWLAPSAGLGGGWHIAPGVRFDLGLDAIAPLGRKQYSVNRSEYVHAPSALSGRLSLGLSFVGD
jgi:hypothetical protein